MVDYGGYIKQQKLKEALGFNGRVNPIAVKTGKRDAYQQALQVRELQQFINRYEYENLPKGLDAKMIERILYYRGRLMLFKLHDTYYSLPFALNGGINVYGRYKTVTPLTFNGSINIDNNGKESMGDGEWLPDVLFDVAYDIEEIDGSISQCVILNDYSQGYSEFVVPRYRLNMILNYDLASILVLIRHNLIASARVNSVQVQSEGQKEAVYEEYNGMEESIIEDGKRIFVVQSVNELKEFLKDKTLETQNYWEAYVSQDNLRENLIGIENNGIFKKKERVLKGEQELEASSADLVYADGLTQRQNAFDIFNAMFGENVIVRESRVISGESLEEDGEEEFDGEI